MPVSMTVYHGTSKENAASILQNGFDLSKVGSSTNNAGNQGSGIYFSPHEKIAGSFGDSILSATVELKQPMYAEDIAALHKTLQDDLGKTYQVGAFNDTDHSYGSQTFTQEAIKCGYDGLINIPKSAQPIVATEVVVFHPEIISDVGAHKSETGSPVLKSWGTVIFTKYNSQASVSWLDLIFKGGPGSGRHSDPLLVDDPSIKATGRNTFKVGFTPHNLEVHAERHLSQHYPGLTQQQYASKALMLIQQPVGGNIDGYKNQLGQIVRYHRATNDFVKGHPNRGITTMFKPTDGKAYFERQKKLENIT